MARKKTQEQFVKEVFDLVGNEYEVLGRYKSTHVKIEMKHNLCGHIYNVAPSKFLNVGRRCPKCNGGVRSNHKEFLKKASKFNFNIIGTYKSNKTPLLVECKKCSNRSMTRPDNLLSGKGCKNCANNYLRELKISTIDVFKKRVFEAVRDEYKVLGDYQGADEKILLKHKICDGEYSVTPNKFIHEKRRCPHCAESSGESLVRHHLMNLNINFKPQFWFKDCRNILPLPFDFAVFDNNKLVGLIEYHGRQHYEPVDIFGGVESFNKTIKNDNIKLNYCKNNNIPLLIIKYDENVEDKLNNFIKCYANPEPSTLETM